MEKLNVTFNLFRIIDDKTNNDIYKDIVKHFYSDEIGFGFTDVYMDDLLLSAVLVKRVPTYYTTWNEEQKIMEKKTLLIMKEIKFFMDFKANLLYVEGGVSSMNYLKQALRNVCWKTFVYDDLKIKPFYLLSTFISDAKLSTLNEISMSDFQFEKVLIGKYTAKLIDAQIPFNLIQEYSDNISKFKACIQVENAEAEIIVKNKNSMVVSCEEEDKYTIFDYLSSKIY